MSKANSKTNNKKQQIQPSEKTSREMLLDATWGYPLAYYVEKLSDNIENNGEQTNAELNGVRLAVYKGILSMLQNGSVDIDNLQEKIADWKTVKQVGDIQKLFKDANTEDFTKDDVKVIKRTIKELDEVVAAIVVYTNKLVDRCGSLADKHEKPTDKPMEQ